MFTPNSDNVKLVRALGRSAFLCLLVLGPGLGCKSEGRGHKKDDRERLTMEMFQEMLRKGTLTPVDSMEDAFVDFHPEMGVTPEEYSLAETGEPLVTLDGARVIPPEPGSRESTSEPEPELDPEPEPALPQPPPNYYAIFGTRIIVHEASGLISKPYPMRANSSTEMMNFIIRFSDFPLWDGEGQQSPDTVTLEVIAKADTEYLSNNMRVSGPAPGNSVEIGDWLMVTAGPELLQDVEDFIDTFAAGPQQIEIEAKIVEFVQRDSLDVGVNDALISFPNKNVFGEFGFSFPNQASPDAGGEVFGTLATIHDGVTYAAMFEALAAYENISIISRPKVVARDGIKAKIESIQKIPFLQVTSINNTGNASTAQAFQEVGVQMYVTPRLVGTGTVALQIDIQASQQTGDRVTLAVGGLQGSVSTPILSTRNAETLVYLKPGQAVILGGLITDRVTERESGIPFLMDLPLIGHLFKSTLKSNEKATLLFFIRPRLIEGSDRNQDF